MGQLKNSKVWRGGKTASKYTLETESTIDADAYFPNRFSEATGIRLTARIPSKGGGHTDVRLVLSEDDFESLAELMLTVDEKKATKAFVAALHFKLNFKPFPDDDDPAAQL